MKIFIDTANVDEIKKAVEWGVIDGITTNPSLIAREDREFKVHILEIVNMIDIPVSVEVISTNVEGMVKEGIEMSKWSQNIVIKIPMTKEGLKAVKILRKQNIKTNVTLVFSVNQALLAAKAGATYISIFCGRLDDIGHDSMKIIQEIVNIFNIYDFNTKTIAASVRHPLHVIEAAKVGVDVVTVPFDVIEKMFNHPLTDVGLERFLNDWKKLKK